ncbi:transcriptional regulator [Opitutales bacterium]|nr:transcriptional regulator [Opitutales bacterium]
MPHLSPINGKQSTQETEQAIEIESIDFFVRMMSILGMPRSVGEIYGLLYFSAVPLPMDQIVLRLGISMGSASQGLKTLRSLKAVRTSYVPGDRRDHYLAETEFRRLFSNFIKEEIMPHMESAKERIAKMEEALPLQNEKSAEFYEIRIEKLKRLTRAGGRLLPTLAGLLKF